jgi:hypothetical protein
MERGVVLEQFRNEPAEFVRGVIGGDPWAVQEAVLKAVSQHPRVTVRSCHGVGKSWVAACAALWFLYTRDPVTVLTTAPTHRQVKEVLWREIRRLHRGMFGNGRLDPALRGEIRETALRLAEDRFALGLTTDEPDRFQGFHSPHILVIVDEASGVEEEIFAAIEGVLTSAEARILLIGNPLHACGTFYDSHRSEAWMKFAVSAFDSPNVAGRDLEDDDRRDAPAERPGLVTARWVWERRLEWGEESPLYQSRVLGQFPDQAADALIRLSWIEAAVARHLPQHRRSPEEVELGVDVARFGDCETVVIARQGPRVLALEAWRKADLMESARRVRALERRYRPWIIKVDSVGVGSGIVDRLRELCDAPVKEINVGKPPRDTERFSMLRDELFFGLRDRFRDGDIAIPDDPRLIDQLAGLTYSITPRGQQVVGSKADLSRRGLGSPDRADALALAFAPIRRLRAIARVGRPR